MRFLICTILMALIGVPAAYAQDKELHIYHDADWSNHRESAESIWRGMHLALSEVDYTVQGYRIALTKKDHRGNVVRSKKNNQDFLSNPSAFAIFSGIHSPPLLRNAKFINENQILTFVPWAAAGPITRYPAEKNWVFRLSVDDTKAGGVLINYALDEKKCKRPHLLLERSPWGDSNLSNMQAALTNKQVSEAHVTRFDWSLKSHTAQSVLQEIHDSGADCIVLVSNALEGSRIAKAMAALDKNHRMPIISHWGITAGNFHERVPAQTREKIDLSFIQSCFSFMEQPMPPHAQKVLSQAQSLFPESIQSAHDIRSPVGFIHAYDLTKIMLAAMQQVKLTDDMLQNREKMRLALENLQTPISGLIKTYQQPFAPYGAATPDAHEALNAENYCMAHYRQSGHIHLIANHGRR